MEDSSCILPSVTLKQGREKSVLRCHPWIFSGAVAHGPEEPLSPGSTVRVLDASGHVLGTGAWNPVSAIAVRLWEFGAERKIDEAFFREKLERAFQLRKTVFGTLPDAFRLVHSESDGLPGLTVDLYSGTAVCQFTGAGAEFHKDLLVPLIAEYASAGSVYDRSDAEVRLKEGLPVHTGLLAGPEVADRIAFTENGVRFLADIRNGHKTGFYLDQRMSRLAVQQAAAGCGEVLNCFCYTGGFGLAAAKGGAKHVLNVDSSAPALALARENASLNAFPETQFETKEDDVFQFLRSCRDSRKSFDLIVLDPPKFADSTHHVEKACRAYKDINLLALKLLRKGGQLFTFSCSGAIDAELFARIVAGAAADAGADLRMTSLLGQGPDHPVSAACPESRYLKGLAGIRF